MSYVLWKDEDQLPSGQAIGPAWLVEDGEKFELRELRDGNWMTAADAAAEAAARNVEFRVS